MKGINVNEEKAPVVQPTEQPVQPAVQPAVQPIEQPVQPAVQPAVQPTEQPVQPAEQPTEQQPVQAVENLNSEEPAITEQIQAEEQLAVEQQSNKDVFDKIESEQQPAQQLVQQPAQAAEQSAQQNANSLVDDGIDSVEDDGQDEPAEPFQASIAEKSPEQLEIERGVKVQSDGRDLTIDKVYITSPRTHKLTDNGSVQIPPKPTQSGNGYHYPVKLAVRFKEDNIIEYYPGLSVWVNDNKLNSFVKINREGASKVTQLFRMAVNHMAGNKFKLVEERINERPVIVPDKADKVAYKAFEKTISDKAFYDYLVGKKVKIAMASGVHDGSPWFRNDIAYFL